MIIKNLQKNRAFVILFAVTLSAILLSIALGLTNIAFRELKFSTNARDTNDAFFAADTGIECAFMNDKSNSHIFEDGITTTIPCAGNLSIPITQRGSDLIWDFTVSGLNYGQQGCANVTVDKRQNNGADPITVITSDGHNINVNGTCASGSNTVEREIVSTY